MIPPMKVTCILWTTLFSTIKKLNNQDVHYPTETGLISVISIYRFKYNSNCLPQFALPQVWFGSLLLCRTLFSLMQWINMSYFLWHSAIWSSDVRKKTALIEQNTWLSFFLIHVMCLLYNKHCELCWPPLIDCMLLSKPAMALKSLVFSPIDGQFNFRLFWLKYFFFIFSLSF